MKTIYLGQVVSLNSGGASMTVTDLRSDGLATLSWTDNDGCAQSICVRKECFFALCE